MLLFFKFLLKVGLIPLNLNLSSNQLTFKMFSKPTLLYILYSFLVVGIGLFCGFYGIGISTLVEFWENIFNQSETTDILTFSVYFILYSLVACNFEVYKNVTKIPENLLLHENLQWPKNGKTLAFMAIVGYIAIVNWLVFKIKAKVESVSTVGVVMGSCVSYGFNLFAGFVITIFFSSWMETLAMICEERQPSRKILQHSMKCKDYYNSLQNGLGTTLIVIFMAQQIVLVISLYMCITTAFYQPYDIATNVVLSFCYAAMSMYQSTNIYVLTMSAEKLFSSFQSLSKSLSMALIGENDIMKIQETKALIKEIENMPPLNGNGYFEIKKETITSIISTTVTYLIILLQFRGSEN